MSSHFTVDGSRSGDTFTITLSGELDIATAPPVEELVREVLADGPPSSIELDWSGLTFMDSTGIRLLLGIVRQCHVSGVDLLWRFSESAQRALDAVGIHDGILRELGTQDTGPDR